MLDLAAEAPMSVADGCLMHLCQALAYVCTLTHCSLPESKAVQDRVRLFDISGERERGPRIDGAYRLMSRGEG